jgi:hypothetical protein
MSSNSLACSSIHVVNFLPPPGHQSQGGEGQWEVSRPPFQSPEWGLPCLTPVHLHWVLRVSFCLGWKVRIGLFSLEQFLCESILMQEAWFYLSGNKNAETTIFSAKKLQLTLGERLSSLPGLRAHFLYTQTWPSYNCSTCCGAPSSCMQVDRGPWVAVWVPLDKGSRFIKPTNQPASRKWTGAK